MSTLVQQMVSEMTTEYVRVDGMVGERVVGGKSTVRGKPVVVRFTKVLNPGMNVENYNECFRATAVQPYFLNQDEQAYVAAAQARKELEYSRRRFVMVMERYVERAKEERETLIKKLNENFSQAYYAMSWLRGTPGVFFKGCWGQCMLENITKLHSDGKTMDEAIDTTIAYSNDALDSRIASWSPENSSSWTSNGCHNEEYEAFKEMKRGW